MTRPLLLVGAGGFGRETAAAVRALQAAGQRTDLLGFLDDDPRLPGRLVDGVPVLGGLDAVDDHPDAGVVLCTGRPDGYASRQRIADRLALPPDRYATVVHPAASVGHGCVLGPGTVLLAGVVATAGVRVGMHVSVMPQVVLPHDAQVHDFATLASGVRLGGAAVVERGAYVGAGALVREDLVVGAWSLVGMGAVVTRDVPAGEVWAGVPARYLRPAPVGQEQPVLVPPLSRSATTSEETL